MTPFEIASIVIGCFTAVGTVGATLAAVGSTIFKSINRLSIKNYEQRLDLENYKDDDDIVVRNKSGHQVTITSIFFTYKECDYHIHSVYYANKRLKLPVVLKPLESFHINKIIDSVLIGIVPRIDYMYVNDENQAVPNEAFYAKYYDDNHIKFTIIDSDQRKHHFKSKYSVTNYLQDYQKWNLLSPWKIDSVQKYVAEKKTPCIICGNWQQDFELYVPNSNISISDLEDKIANLASACLDEYDTDTYGFAFVYEDEMKYYVINDDENSDMAKSIIISVCTKKSIRSITKISAEYLIWNPEEDLKNFNKKMGRKNIERQATFEELLQQMEQHDRENNIDI
ncbi:MAG: hypothetical protein NC037_01000 [Bacteroides sp.]|nr:hypothetical protein [Bacillota bacterium]MCM1393500.1 hypothetical protein [[Eubacterium] siraeum]MCM1455093.1 hypothetical protein [Bacteroides sp.]